MPIPLILGFMAVRAIKAAYDAYQSSNSTSTYVPPPKTPEKVITFVGATGAGKSSVLNALLGYEAFKVGAEHGTTRSIAEKNYIAGYRVRDTPGILDSTDYSSMVLSAIEDSELVVYTTSGQLYRPELDMIKNISEKQRTWDRGNSMPGRRKLALYISQQDTRENTMPSASRAKVEVAIREQVATWIPSSHIVLGAAASIDREIAQIEALQRLLHAHMTGI